MKTSRFLLAAAILVACPGALTSRAVADETAANAPLVRAILEGTWRLQTADPDTYAQWLQFGGTASGEWQQSEGTLPVTITYYVLGDELLIQHPEAAPFGDWLKQRRFRYEIDGDTLVLFGPTGKTIWKKGPDQGAVIDNKSFTLRESPLSDTRSLFDVETKTGDAQTGLVVMVEIARLAEQRGFRFFVAKPHEESVQIDFFATDPREDADNPDIFVFDVRQLASLIDSQPAAVGSWSQPTNGIQARITVAEKGQTNGTRSLVPYLELKNVRDLAAPIQVRCGEGHVRFELIGPDGKAIGDGQALSRSGPHADPGTIVLPIDSTIRINMNCRNWGVPKAAAMIATDSGAWVLQPEQEGKVFLQATLTGEKVAADAGDVWHGRIQTPAIRIAWSK